MALVGRNDPGVLKHHYLPQKKLLPVFLIEEIVTFHFIELQLKLHKITAVARFQRRNEVYHVFDIPVELPALAPFEIDKRQVPLLVIELILQVEQYDFVKFVESAFGMIRIRAKQQVPVVACLHQLLQPFEEDDAIHVLFIIEHGFTALFYKAPVIGACPYHVKHKIIGLLLYDVFFQDNKE